jgi:hypothetical protein
VSIDMTYGDLKSIANLNEAVSGFSLLIYYSCGTIQECSKIQMVFDDSAMIQIVLDNSDDSGSVQ